MTEQPNLPPRYGRPIERDHALAQEGPAPDGWRTVALGDIADVVGGGTPSTKEPDNFDGDIPWLTPRDLSGAHDRYIERGERSLSLRGLDSSSAKLLPTGSVLLSTRAPIGYVALAKNQIATNQGFRSLLVRDGALPEYLYYWLKLNTEELERHASGSTFREISGSSLKEIRLRLPPLDEQRAIARVLGALDDKIELNRRMSATLEAMARALFKSWFVDFEPVRAKAEGRPSGLPPALDALFPASFEASKLGEIPSGWGVGTLGDVAVERRQGVRLEEMAPGTPYIGLEHMPRRSIALSEWGTTDGLASNKSRFEQGDILFGKLRPYFHKVGVAPLDGVCSTDIVVLAPMTDDWFGFVLGHASSDDFVDYTDAGSTGTRMPRTKWKDMARYTVALPDRALAAAFNERVNPLVVRIASAIRGSRARATQRDALLPRLVSGEVRVEDAP